MSKKSQGVVFLATKLVRGKSDPRVADAAATAAVVVVMVVAVAMAADTVVAVVTAADTVVAVVTAATAADAMAADAMAENVHTAITNRFTADRGSTLQSTTGLRTITFRLERRTPRIN